MKTALLGILAGALGVATFATDAPRTLGPDGNVIAASAASAADSNLVFRRVWSGGYANFYASTPSPDGRYLTEIDWFNGELAVRDLLTGQLENLTNVGPWDKNWSFPESSVFSPDGKQLAVTWFDMDNNAYEIRIFEFDKSGSRVLLPNSKENEYSFVEDWSDDGAHVLATLFGGQDRADLVVIDVADGSRQVIKAGTTPPQLAAFSPDARHVVFDWVDEDQPRRNYDIYLSTRDGSRVTKIVGGPANDRLMGWTPDGSRVLFYSDRELSHGIWQLPMRNGAPAGEPTLLKGDVWGLMPLGFSRSAYYYGVWTEQPQIHTASVDLAAGRLLAPPTRVTEQSASTGNGGGIWSPDGQYFAFGSNPGGYPYWHLVVRSVSGDDEREYIVDVSNPNGLQDLQWMPDGASIVFGGIGSDGSSAHFRLDLQTGEVHRIVSVPALLKMVGADADEVQLYQRAVAPDGDRVYFVTRRWETSDIPTQSTLYAYDVASDGVTKLAEVPFRVRGLAVAPDGKTLALGRRHDPVYTIYLMPSSGGEAREVHQVTSPIGRLGLRWSHDGRYLLFLRGEDTDQGETIMDLLRLELSSGEVRTLHTATNIMGISVHPEGRRIAFVAGAPKGEVWMIENIPGTESPVVGTGER